MSICLYPLPLKSRVLPVYFKVYKQRQSQRYQMKQLSSKYQSQNFNTSNLAVSIEEKRQAPQSFTHCSNHEERRATFKYHSAQNNEQTLYCEKCAIMLASQGFGIVKLQHNAALNNNHLSDIDQSRSERQQEIQRFIDELFSQINELSYKDNQAEYSLRMSEQHFNGLIEQTSNYFKQIQDVIEVQKFITLNAILSQRVQLQQELRLMRTSLLNEIEMLTGFSNDIQNNMEAVEEVEEGIYQSIMDNYRGKLQLSYEFNHLTSQVLKIAKPAIVFPDIPRTLYSLADNVHLRSEQNRRQSLKYHQDQHMPRDSMPHRRSGSRSSWQNTKSNDCVPQRRLDGLRPLSKRMERDGNHLTLLRNQAKNSLRVAKSLQTRNQGRKNQFVYSQPQVFVDDLGLPQIEQNDRQLQMNTQRRSTNIFLEESVPEQMVNNSNHSFSQYYDSDTVGYDLNEIHNEEATPETVLLF